MYNAIIEVSENLKELNIPHKIISLYDGYQIKFPFTKADIIEHEFSYGHEKDLMEVMGFNWNIIQKGEYAKYDDVLGYLSVREVLKLVVCKYIEKCF